MERQDPRAEAEAEYNRTLMREEAGAEEQAEAQRMQETHARGAGHKRRPDGERRVPSPRLVEHGARGVRVSSRGVPVLSGLWPIVREGVLRHAGGEERGPPAAPHQTRHGMVMRRSGR